MRLQNIFDSFEPSIMRKVEEAIKRTEPSVIGYRNGVAIKFQSVIDALDAVDRYAPSRNLVDMLDLQRQYNMLQVQAIDSRLQGSQLRLLQMGGLYGAASQGNAYFGRPV